MLQDPNVERYVQERIEPLQEQIKELQATIFKLMQANNLHLQNVSGSVFKGDCDKNIHWYAGVYSDGIWIYNKCAYCGKRQNQ